LKVTSTEFQQNVGRYQDAAQQAVQSRRQVDRIALFCSVVGVLALPLAGRANPMPAGSCSALDDGVATRQWTSPTAVKMDVPEGSAENFQSPFKMAIVDLSFVIDPSGSVSSIKALCASPANSAFVATLVQAASGWRFAPIGQPENVAYRVIAPARLGRSIQPTFIGVQPTS
jgi:hypothetical protein